MVASCAGETRVVIQLLLAGANPQLRDNHQRTADDWMQLKQNLFGVWTEDDWMQLKQYLLGVAIRG